MAHGKTLDQREVSEFYFPERIARNPVTGVPLGVTGPNREYRRRHLGGNHARITGPRLRDLVTKQYLARAMARKTAR